jgi:hypothetical protein
VGILGVIVTPGLLLVRVTAFYQGAGGEDGGTPALAVRDPLYQQAAWRVREALYVQYLCGDNDGDGGVRKVYDDDD